MFLTGNQVFIRHHTPSYAVRILSSSHLKKTKNKTKTRSHINVSDDDTLSICVQEVVPFRISANNLGHAPLHLRKAGKHVLCNKMNKNKLQYHMYTYLVTQ